MGKAQCIMQSLTFITFLVFGNSNIKFFCQLAWQWLLQRLPFLCVSQKACSLLKRHERAFCSFCSFSVKLYKIVRHIQFTQLKKMSLGLFHEIVQHHQPKPQDPLLQANFAQQLWVNYFINGLMCFCKVDCVLWEGNPPDLPPAFPKIKS